MDLSLNPSIERFTLLISIEETISNMLLSATITKKNTINLFSKIKKLKFGVIKVDFAILTKMFSLSVTLLLYMCI